MEISSINVNQAALTTAASPVPEGRAQTRELIQAVKTLNATGMSGQNNELTFVLARATRRRSARIVERQTKEVVRQIPPEYALRTAGGLKVTR